MMCEVRDFDSNYINLLSIKCVDICSFFLTPNLFYQEDAQF